jgi:hypothetical protein
MSAADATSVAPTTAGGDTTKLVKKVGATPTGVTQTVFGCRESCDDQSDTRVR